MVRQTPSKARMGFTLVELILVLAVLGMMASIAAPRMGWATMDTVQAKNAARQFANDLRLTRSLAITSSDPGDPGYTLQLLPNGGPYTNYRITDLGTLSYRIDREIPAGVNCTGEQIFKYELLGTLHGGITKQLTFTGGGDTVVVTANPIGRITVQ